MVFEYNHYCLFITYHDQCFLSLYKLTSIIYFGKYQAGQYMMTINFVNKHMYECKICGNLHFIVLQAQSLIVNIYTHAHTRCYSICHHSPFFTLLPHLSQSKHISSSKLRFWIAQLCFPHNSILDITSLVCFRHSSCFPLQRNVTLHM